MKRTSTLLKIRFNKTEIMTRQAVIARKRKGKGRKSEIWIGLPPGSEPAKGEVEGRRTYNVVLSLEYINVKLSTV